MVNTRVEALQRVRDRVARLYRDRQTIKHGKPAYHARVSAQLAAQLGALDWAIDRAIEADRTEITLSKKV